MGVVPSLAIADELPRDGCLLDVGSGGGFPAIPLAIARPDLRVTCTEPSLQKAAFLREMAVQFGLNLSVETCPAEVFLRAVAGPAGTPSPSGGSTSATASSRGWPRPWPPAGSWPSGAVESGSKTTPSGPPRPGWSWSAASCPRLLPSPSSWPVFHVEQTGDTRPKQRLPVKDEAGEA